VAQNSSFPNNINYSRKEKKKKFSTSCLRSWITFIPRLQPKETKITNKNRKKSGDSRRALTGERTPAVGTRAKQGVQRRPAKHKLYTMRGITD
jgi:hypothetical protein